MKKKTNKIELELDLANYARKYNLKNSADEYAKNNDLDSLKSDIDKLDIDKLEKVPSGLSNLKSKGNTLDVDKLVSLPVELDKLSDVVKIMLVKRLNGMNWLKDY